MRGNLPARSLTSWHIGEAIGLYEKVWATFKGRKKFILRRWPPYTNGNIHFGACGQQDPQDIIVKSEIDAGV